MIEYRLAKLQDIDNILKLHHKFHCDTISDDDRDGGFITATFTYNEVQDLIENHGSITLAFDGDMLVGFLFAADWEYWKRLEIFSYMISHLSENKIADVTITQNNSYHHGPVCVDTDYRGQGILPKMFEISKAEMRKKYDILATFVNILNKPSYVAHKNKLGLDVTKIFQFGNQKYYEMARHTK